MLIVLTAPAVVAKLATNSVDSFSFSFIRCIVVIESFRVFGEFCVRFVESGYVFFARRLRRERRVFYFPWRITLALEGSQTSLRRESAEGRCKRGSLITFYIAFVTTPLHTGRTRSLED